MGEVKSTDYYKTDLKAEKSKIKITVSNGHLILNDMDTTLRTTYEFDNNDIVATETIYISSGSTITLEFTYHTNKYNGYSVTYLKDGSAVTECEGDNEASWGYGGVENPGAFEFNPYVYTIGASSGNKQGGCIYGDAEVLMADGTTKLAKDVKLGDVVLTWSFAEGKYVATPIIFVERLKGELSHKTTLYFNDGTKAEIANGQSFFDVNKREFVSINSSNVYEYIGITIMGYNNGEITYKQIVNATVDLVFEDTYEFITAYEYSFIYDNVLTMERFLLCRYMERSNLKDLIPFFLQTVRPHLL